jgi:DNA adenine methylase
MFWRNCEDEGVLSDANPDLAITYRVVKDDVDSLIEALGEHYYDKDHYYEVRARDPKTMSPAARAARMIFMNRTGFNGLYRVNKSGRFNVPFGRYDNPTICDAVRIRRCAEALRGVSIEHRDFLAVGDQAVAGDFVYFDPPYVPLSASSNFTSYTRNGFTLDDQVRLRDLARDLHARGVHVLLSNSSAPKVYELYDSGFGLREVLVGRAINSKGGGRGKVAELLISAS